MALPQVHQLEPQHRGDKVIVKSTALAGLVIKLN